MLGGDRDENDPLARRDAAIAMDDGRAQKRPARLGLTRRACDLFLGHAGIMLELERGERSALVATVADKAHHRADVGSPARERFGLRARVEILSLDADSSPSLSAAGHRRKERHFLRPRDGSVAAGVNPIERGANSRRFVERVRVALAALARARR